MIFDFMSYKTKIVLAVIATGLALTTIIPLFPLIGLVTAGDVPFWLVLIPLALTIIFAVCTIWLWKKALQEHAAATGKLYPGEKLARQLQAEHGGELLYSEPGTNIRNWTIAVEGADGFRRTIMTKSGKEAS